MNSIIPANDEFTHKRLGKLKFATYFAGCPTIIARNPYKRELHRSMKIRIIGISKPGRTRLLRLLPHKLHKVSNDYIWSEHMTYISRI